LTFSCGLLSFQNDSSFCFEILKGQLLDDPLIAPLFVAIPIVCKEFPRITRERGWRRTCLLVPGIGIWISTATSTALCPHRHYTDFQLLYQDSLGTGKRRDRMSAMCSVHVGHSWERSAGWLLWRLYSTIRVVYNGIIHLP
jgi:hypothetical protein